MSKLKPNTILNRNQYKIKKVIGQGGFGITYLAEELGYYRTTGYGEAFVTHQIPEIVVVKELFYKDFCNRDEHTGLVSISDSSRKIQFQKLVKNQLEEGVIIRQLQHPNIVKTRDIFEENDTAYMVMNYIESTDLEEQIKTKGNIPKKEAIKYMLQILDAVDYFHNKIAKKILHLDISPSNVLIDSKNNNAILIDFGSALSYDNLNKKIEATTSQIVTGRKKHYSPNEQGDIDNLKSFDATFDTYAIGATLYHLLCGELPPLSALLSSGREEFVPPSTIAKNNNISDFLDAIVAKAIAPLYKNRYHTALQMKNDLLKESDYITLVKQLNKLKTDNKKTEAKKLLNDNKGLFLETNTLLKFEAQLKETAETQEKTFVDKAYTENTTTKTPFIEKDYTEPITSTTKQKTVEKEDDIVTKPVGSNKPKIKKTEPEANFFQKNKKPILIVLGSLITLPILGFILLFIIGTLSSDENTITKELTPFTENNLYGYKQGDSLVITPSYTTAEAFTDGKAKVSRNDSIFYIDPQGNMIEFISMATTENEPDILDNYPIVEPTIEEKEPTWKTQFQKSFAEIERNETRNTNENNVYKYKNLKQTLPASATIENKQINDKIAYFEKLIRQERLAEEQKRERKERLAREREEERKRDEENRIDYATYNKKMESAKGQINSLNAFNRSEDEKKFYKKKIVEKLKEALIAKPNDAEAKRLLNQYQ